MKDVLPYVGPILTLILFLLGVLIWRVQLVSKRKFEVAEQAMVAFGKSTDALAKIRSPVLYKALWHWPSFPPSSDWFAPVEADSYRAHILSIFRDRFAAAEAAFGELRVAQVLTEVHFGNEAAKEFEGLFLAKAAAEHSVEMLFNTLPTLAEERERGGELLNRMELAKNAASALTPLPDNTPVNGVEISATAIANARGRLFERVRPALINPDLNSSKPWAERILNFLLKLP
jgi:hypothetical protein